MTEKDVPRNGSNTKSQDIYRQPWLTIVNACVGQGAWMTVSGGHLALSPPAAFRAPEAILATLHHTETCRASVNF